MILRRLNYNLRKHIQFGFLDVLESLGEGFGGAAEGIGEAGKGLGVLLAEGGKLVGEITTTAVEAKNAVVSGIKWTYAWGKQKIIEGAAPDKPGYMFEYDEIADVNPGLAKFYNKIETLKFSSELKNALKSQVLILYLNQRIQLLDEFTLDARKAYQAIKDRVAGIEIAEDQDNDQLIQNKLRQKLALESKLNSDVVITPTERENIQRQIVDLNLSIMRLQNPLLEVQEVPGEIRYINNQHLFNGSFKRYDKLVFDVNGNSTMNVVDQLKEINAYLSIFKPEYDRYGEELKKLEYARNLNINQLDIIEKGKMRFFMENQKFV